ncbi:hypothetical protein [Paraburkholderia susongensis]|uniref:hypothetical protein n=1 Tax=Paraburkholderia susongensis TaxID=1515439 RepID=UPI001FCA16D3|nr:hypothetical protein [Paraburkholderia susongensis]
MMTFDYEVESQQRLSLTMYSCKRIDYTACHAGIDPGSNHGFRQGFRQDFEQGFGRSAPRRGGDEHGDADVRHDRLARGVVAAKPF